MSVIAKVIDWQVVPDASGRPSVRMMLEMSPDDVARATPQELDAVRRGAALEFRILSATDQFIRDYGRYLAGTIILPGTIADDAAWAKYAEQLFAIGAGPQPRRHVVVPAAPFVVAWLNGGCSVCTDQREDGFGLACRDCFAALDSKEKEAFGSACAAVNLGRAGALDFNEARLSNTGAYLAGACSVCGVIDIDRPRWSYAHPECWNRLPLDEAVRRTRECDAAKASAGAKVAAPKVVLDL